MATWPSTSPSTTTTATNSDSISGARADINQAITNINSVVDMFDMSTLADDRILVYDSASATFKVEDNVSGFTGDLAGNVLYDSTQDVIIEDDVVVRPNNTDDRKATIGDYFITAGANTYTYTAAVMDGGAESWPLFLFVDYDGISNGSPSPVTGVTNPALLATVYGGTPGSPAALGSSKRLISFQATGAIDSTGTVPSAASFRVMAVTTETQSSTNRGNKATFQTTKTGTATALNTLLLEGDKVTVNAAGGGGIGGSGGEGTISAGADLVLDAATGSEIHMLKNLQLDTISGTNNSIQIGTDTNARSVALNDLQLIWDPNSSGYTGNIQISCNGLGFLIPEHVDMDSVELSSQPTGTPSNTTTPTGYIEIIINGTTRYMPYYT